jgi:glutaredoxin
MGQKADKSSSDLLSSHPQFEEKPPDAGIVMYCTPWCPDCMLARAWLKKNNIAFTEVDISNDLDAARQVRSWGNGNQVTPTFEINGQIVLDFDEKKLRKLILNK